VFGVLGALHPSIIIAAGTESAQPEHRSVGMGLFFTTYCLGGAVMPGLFGVSLLCLPLFLLHRFLSRTGVRISPATS